MLTHNLGYPRIGSHRELKKAAKGTGLHKSALPNLWRPRGPSARSHWRLQQEAGIDLVPCNDFSFYDHVLISRLWRARSLRANRPLLDQADACGMDLYFAMARGCQ